MWFVEDSDLVPTAMMHRTYLGSNNALPICRWSGGIRAKVLLGRVTRAEQFRPRAVSHVFTATEIADDPQNQC
jgi:hypothetical protein